LTSDFLDGSFAVIFFDCIDKAFFIGVFHNSSVSEKRSLVIFRS
jgi:hypothetical protein